MNKVVTFTSLYPNSRQPGHGVFVEQRLRHLVANGNTDVRVVAPVPWFPLSQSLFGRYAKYKNVPSDESRFGISLRHPRYIVFPKIGMSIAPLLLALGSYRALRALQREGFDPMVLDCHYFYPDGVAGAILGGLLKKPIVITARGTDINLIPKYLIPRLWIKWAAKRSHRIVTVCQALATRLVELGVDCEKISVLRNGVDLRTFSPKPRDEIRKRLGMHGITCITAGHLVERKGHDIVIRAVAGIPGVNLLVVGAGPCESSLRNLADALGLATRVKFIGAVDHSEMPDYYSAADLLILASSREGMANVLLEALACGTPVVATDSWGTPEVVSAPAAGVLVAERSPEAVREGIRRLLASPPTRDQTRRFAEQFGWESTTKGQEQIFGEICANSR